MEHQPILKVNFRAISTLLFWKMVYFPYFVVIEKFLNTTKSVTIYDKRSSHVITRVLLTITSSVSGICMHARF